MIKKITKDEKGFTLIEMIIVLFIISLLMLLIVPGMSDQQQKAGATGTEALHTVLQSQVDLYRLENKKYPASFSDLKDEGYLNDKQLTQANSSFELSGGRVTVITGDGTTE